MRKYITILTVLSSSLLSTAQTVIRMKMPNQSENALTVATLYNEPLPTGVSIVLGVMGYEINGGSAPYQYEWLKNNQVIATGEIAVIVPEIGSNYVLRVKDKNLCSVENAINISSSAKVSKKYLSETIKISVKQLSNTLSIDFKGFVPENTILSIFDVQGKLYLKQSIAENTTLPLNLTSAAYIVVIGNSELVHVQKIIVK